MEKLKVKHDHKLTDIVKVAIFTIFLSAPFFAILFECCYATFNKNSVGAYTSNETAFYQAVDRIATQPLFNWTTNTGMYTGIHAMTNGMGVSINSIDIILTYMTFIIVIYVIFDIVLGVFKLLTHLVNEK